MAVSNSRRLQSYGIVIGSGILFGAVSWYPAYCWPAVFFYLTGIFYAAQRYSISFAHGFLWGVCAYAMHWYALLPMFTEKYAYSWLSAAFLYAGLVGYAALYAGCWFVAARYLSRWFSCHISWLIATVGYLWWTHTTMFFITGQWIGYPFTDPLLFLAVMPRLLYTVSYCGTFVLYAALIGGSWQLAQIIKNKTFKKCIVFWYVPFLVGFALPQHEEHIPCFVKELAAVHLGQFAPHPLDCAQQIHAAIIATKKRSPAASLFILPESAFPFALNEHNGAVQLWQLNTLEEHEKIVLGAYYNDDLGASVNALFIIDHMRITDCYVKTKLMPFAEYLPSFFTCFKKGKKQNEKGWVGRTANPSQLLSLNNNITISPRICFEFFFHIQNKEISTHTPLLVLVNDSWFTTPYAPNILKLSAIYTALCGNQPIIYIGYKAGFFISKQGKTYIV